MSGSPTSSTLIDVIVLVFAKSELKAVVGTDALRTVLEGSHRALFPEPDTLALQPVYDLLEDQPGFDKDKVVAPMCRIKSWEAQLKTKVLLPSALEGLDRRAIDDKAMGVGAFDSDLDKLLKPTSVNTPVPITRVLESETVSEKEARAGNRRVQIAAAAALLGLAAAGVSIYMFVVNPSSDTTVVTITPTELSNQIPMTSVQKSEDGVVVGVLGDQTWIEKPESERRVQMQLMIDKLRAQNATGFMLIDRKGTPIGSVFVRGKPVVSFTAKSRELAKSAKP